MKILVLYLVLFLLLTGCFFGGRNNYRNNFIVGNVFTATIPIIRDDGSIKILKNAVTIYSLNDLLMYEYQYLFDSIDLRGATQREYDKMLLIHKESEQKGLLYRTGEQSPPQKVS